MKIKYLTYSLPCSPMSVISDEFTFFEFRSYVLNIKTEYKKVEKVCRRLQRSFVQKNGKWGIVKTVSCACFTEIEFLNL